jgi:pilus assembly protein CpaE
MTSVASLKPDQEPILACTVSRNVQNFDLLIDGMELEFGESWGDLSFDDAALFLDQPEAAALEFLAIAVDGGDAVDPTHVDEIIKAAKARRIKVILIVDQVSPIALHQLLRLGAEDFVPYPLPEGALRDAIARIRQPVPSAVRLAAVPNEPAAEQRPALIAKGDHDGVLLPVHGLAGGVGATTFAANLAWELATISKTDAPRVCLIDLGFQFGSVATYLDLPRKEAVFEVLSDVSNIDSDVFLQSMVTFNDKLHVFTAPNDMLPLEIVTGEDIAHLIGMAEANFDFVIVDMPSAVVSWTETILSRAHAYFALMELDLRSAQNILRMVRTLKSEDLPVEKLRFVLNRAPKFTELSARSRVKRMAESLDIDIAIQLPDGGRQVTQANDHGQPISEGAAKNPLRKEIQRLAKSLHDLNKAVASGKR